MADGRWLMADGGWQIASRPWKFATFTWYLSEPGLRDFRISGINPHSFSQVVLFRFENFHQSFTGLAIIRLMDRSRGVLLL